MLALGMKIKINCSKIIFLALLILAMAACKNSGKTGQDGSSKADSTGVVKPANAKLAALNEAISKEPAKADLYIQRAHLLEETNQMESSLRDALQAVKLDSTNAGYNAYLGHLYQKDGSHGAAAIKAYEKATKYDPTNKEAFVRLGQLYFEVKNREASMGNLNAALKLDRNQPEAFYYIGRNFYEMGQVDKATTFFQKAIDLKGDYFEPYLILGVIYADKKDKKAESYLTSALHLNPSSVAALVGRGTYYQNTDSLRLAEEDYKKALELDSTNRFASFNMGWILQVKQQQYADAIPYYTKAIQDNPQYAEAFHNRAICYEKTGHKLLSEVDYDRETAILRDEKLAPASKAKPGEKSPADKGRKK
jgi:Tfp pilus assembly protein PilF